MQIKLMLTTLIWGVKQLSSPVIIGGQSAASLALGVKQLAQACLAYSVYFSHTCGAYKGILSVLNLFFDASLPQFQVFVEVCGL